MSRMQFHDGIRGFYSRVHKMIGLRRRKQEKRRLDISAPFNFQKVNMDLAGISADELSLLKEQAVASRIGIAEPEFDEYFHQPSVLSKAASGSLVNVASVSSPLVRQSF